MPAFESERETEEDSDMVDLRLNEPPIQFGQQGQNETVFYNR